MRSAIMLAVALLAVSITGAEARQRPVGVIDCDMRGCFSRSAEVPRPAQARARHHRAKAIKRVKVRVPVSPLVPARSYPEWMDQHEKKPELRGSLAKLEIDADKPLAALADQARQYLGKTARQLGLPNSLWCSDFVNMITGGGTRDRMARSWLSRPKMDKPELGAIVVLARGRSGVYGHVGVLASLDRDGNPTVISGNGRGNRVSMARYPKHRVLAYVIPPLKPAGLLEAGGPWAMAATSA